VERRIAFDSSPELVNISFPVLRPAKEIMINNTAAVKLDKGISMGVIAVATLILWSIMKSWWWRRRYTQENGENKKVVTD
jgi:hypothetical protein